MNNVYSEIKLPKVSEEIVRQIKSLIKEGKLKPGEKLPPEREFAELLGVGRSSLREAINTLDTLGFIEIKKRKGIFVRGVSSRIISDPLRQILEEDKSTLPQLYEIRKDIELASAYMAAKLRTQEDLARIKKCLESMEKDAQHSRFLLSDDLEFHVAVAQATHNFLRVHIIKDIFDLNGEFIDYALMKIVQEKNNVLILFQQHEAIFQAIEQSDEEAARAMMNKHLTWVNDKISGFLKQ